MNTFAELAKINVNEHTEKKGDLTYLSWAWAVDQLLRLDNGASWEYRWVGDKPYATIGDTCMVFCTVTAFGRARTAQLPVMDYKNRAIPNPDAMNLNTAMQRCLAKAIALHGIGLYIYAGEDLPPSGIVKRTISPTDGCFDALSKEDQEKAREISMDMVDHWAHEREFAAYEAYYKANLSQELQLGIWELLKPHSEMRNKLKRMHKEAEAA